MYFSPDGKSAIVVAEAFKRLDFRDPNTMALQARFRRPSAPASTTPTSPSTASTLIFTCEFQGASSRSTGSTKVLGYLGPVRARHAAGHPRLPRRQDLLRRRDDAGGVYIIDGDAFTETNFIPTGVGTHGLYPSRDGRKLYVANRGSHRIGGPPTGRAACACSIRHTTRSRRPGRSPAAAAPTWATSAPTARRCGCPVATTTRSTRSTPPPASSRRIPVGKEPHGLAVWPQPGRFSLGHTGNMR